MRVTTINFKNSNQFLEDFQSNSMCCVFILSTYTSEFLKIQQRDKIMCSLL